MESSKFKSVLELGKGRDLVFDNKGTVIDAFLYHRNNQPEATAVVDEHGSLTYNELNRRSDLLAEKLLSQGVVPGDFVAIKLPRINELKNRLL